MNGLIALAALLLSFPSLAGGVWTGFDLVRNRLGAWGSNETTSFVKITSSQSCRDTLSYLCSPINISSIGVGSNFGYAVANIGDLNGDGIDDLAVGAPGDLLDYGGDIGPQIAAGSVYILFLDDNTTVSSYVRISGNVSGGPEVFSNDQFGYSLAALGDLDGDGIVDLAVGAPGYIISSAYILYLNSNGTVRSHRLIRGAYSGQVPDSLNQTSLTFNMTQNYTFNGPPITYGCRFAAAMSVLGDIDGNNVTDLAIGQVDDRTGKALVYLLLLAANGTVLSYTTIGPNIGGGPDIASAFTRFGAAIMPFPDLNNDSIPELVIGAPALYEAGSLNLNAGTVFVLQMLANGTVNRTTTISETYGRRLGSGRVLPFVPYDECGSSLTFIGDINHDRSRQRRPEQLSPNRDESIPDIVMGCPQRQSEGGAGRLFFVYLTKAGQIAGYTVLPAPSDRSVIGQYLSPYDLFGQSLATYPDMDSNGMKEIVVGAPGDDGNGVDSGAVYIIYPRRRRHHWIPYDYLTYILLVTLIPGIWCLLCCCGIIYFFWHFRRVPDDAEIIVKRSGMKVGAPRTRTRYTKKSGQVHTEQYTA